MDKAAIRIRVPGTTANCGPGFDSIGIACNVYNEMELILRKEDKLTIEVYGEGCKIIPCDARNIVWKSMQGLLKKANSDYKGAWIRMDNRIPLSRGLGSSAAAIVGGLAAANMAIGNVFSKQTLFQMATEIEGHPDNVAPAIFGGVTLSIVKDGKPECLSFLPKLDLKMVVAVPSFNLPTKLARKALPSSVPMEDAVFNVGRAALLAGALLKGDLYHLKNALDDRLHQPYRKKLVPGMEEVFQAANAHGAVGTVLSGAGPCLIAFTVERMEEIGEAMVESFNAYDVEATYSVLEIDAHGVKIL